MGPTKIAVSNKQIALKWFEAFNEHHLEKLLALYDDSAQHYSPKLKIRLPETKGLIKGKESLRTWWKDSFDRLPSLQYEVIKLTADDEQVFMEYVRHVNDEEDLSVGEVLQIENGLIVFSRVYHG
ncbi:MAG: nuclear transport factor 2 family protein [Bacteroidota bacterium]